MKITRNEQSILNYMKEIQGKHDNTGNFDYSTIEIKDIESIFDKPQTAVGVLGSLTKKGLVSSESVNDEYNIYYLTKKAREYLGMQLSPN